MTADRSVFARAPRTVVKIGSSSLTTPGGGLDLASVEALTIAVADANADRRQVVVVTSGAIAGAMGVLGLKTRPRDLATQQAAASVGQGALLAAYQAAFARRGLVVGQVLLTAEDMVSRAHYRNAQRTFYRLMELGVVPLVNENDTVATDEIRFGDNDRLAALVAHLVHADALILLSDVAGLYDCSPKVSGANLISDVRRHADLLDVDASRPGGSGIGSGGMRTKISAAKIAAGAGVPVLLAHSDEASKALSGAPIGTFFHVTGKRVPTRLLWLRHTAATSGAVILDPGAVRAVVDRRKSLLAAGIMAVRGEFSTGDPIDLLDESGHTVGRGLVNFDSGELPQLLGRSTQELAKELGSSYKREIIHRDDLVVLAD